MNLNRIESWTGFVLLTFVTIAGLAAVTVGVVAYKNHDIPKVEGMALVTALALVVSGIGWPVWRKERRSESKRHKDSDEGGSGSIRLHTTDRRGQV